MQRQQNKGIQQLLRGQQESIGNENVERNGFTNSLVCRHRAKLSSKICADVLDANDCAIYYTEDPSADLSGENNHAGLARFNLFLIPVTFLLLTKPNWAMDHDYRFAAEQNIPALPFIMEHGIDEFLTPGESFWENIDGMLKNSKLFTLLVTPNLLDVNAELCDRQ